jgi:hypothetical protein
MAITMHATPATTKTSKPASQISPADVHEFVAGLFLEDMHVARVLSLAQGVTGVIHAAALSIRSIGHGLALARGTSSKHASSKSIGC